MNMKMEWHSLRKRRNPMIFPMLHLFIPYDRKIVGTDIYFVHILEGEWQNEYFSEESYNSAGSYFLKEMQNDKDFIKKRFVISKKLSKELLGFCHKNLSKSLSKCSDQQLIFLLEQFYSLYRDFSVVNVAPWIFAPDRLIEALNDELNRIGADDINNIISVLSSPNTPSYTKQEEIGSLDLAIYLKKNDVKNIVLDKKFNAHVRKYFAIPFNYIGPEVWDKEYYCNKISNLCQKSLADLTKERDEIILSFKSLREKQKSLSKQIKLPSHILSLFEDLKYLTLMQDDKKIRNEAHYYLGFLYEEIARRVGLEKLDCYVLNVDEIRAAVIDKKDLSSLAKERRKLSIAFLNKGLIIMSGEKAKDFAKQNNLALPSQQADGNITTLNGKSASPGIIRGNVCVVNDPSEFKNFKEGDILVATMTTPNFMPIMKKAKAIITD